MDPSLLRLTTKKGFGMADHKLPLQQGNKHLYKINGKVRLSTKDNAKKMKDLGLSVTKVTKAP